MIPQLEPQDLRARLAAGEDLCLLDVRESFELDIASLEGVVHIPLGELMARSDELDPEREIVCICHHGIRSQRAAQFLATSGGFERVANLRGGIDAWSASVDASVPRY
jgi:rhodanese-related sulfurtransferase